jgi:hypothetical protein
MAVIENWNKHQNLATSNNSQTVTISTRVTVSANGVYFNGHFQNWNTFYNPSLAALTAQKTSNLIASDYDKITLYYGQFVSDTPHISYIDRDFNPRLVDGTLAVTLIRKFLKLAKQNATCLDVEIKKHFEKTDCILFYYNAGSIELTRGSRSRNRKRKK